MGTLRYQAIGPVLSGAGSRAFLGLEIFEGEARPIVLVWVPERIADDPQLVEALGRETRWATRLDHPNILRVHGLAKMEEGLARVVEFADGEPLSYILQYSGPIPPPFAARIIADAALGVHYAHTNGGEAGKPLLHGDLRPGTLLLSYAGLTKVSGYGALSLVTEDGQDRWSEERRIRAAPEQLHGSPASTQTDVYLLGLTLYECLTGRPPFADAGALSAAMQHGEKPDLPLEALPPTLAPVLRRATAREPARRYATALELREAIDACAGPLPTHNDLSRYLNGLMKDDKRRGARQHELDAAIADFAKKQWQRRGNRQYSDEITAAGALMVPGLKEMREAAAAAERAAPPARRQPPPLRPEPPPAPPPQANEGPPSAAPVLVAPPRARQGRPAPAEQELPPPMPVVAPPAVSAPPAAPPPAAAPAARGARQMMWIPIGVSLVILAVAAWLRFGGTDAPREAPPVAPAVTGVAPPPPNPAATASPVVPPPSPAPVGTAPAVVPPEPVAAAAPPEPSPAPQQPPQEPPPPAAPALTELRLTVKPEVAVSIDGKPAGRSPITVTLAPGRHRVTLTEPGRGINVSKSIVVPRGSPANQTIELEMGSITLDGPPGSEVLVDGKLVGRAPIEKEVPIFEGNHQIQVNLGKAKWRQKFSVSPGENMHFTVYSQ